jgi:ribose/xylose/arabinose/galactoside ABC-type transport system permease subunit
VTIGVLKNGLNVLEVSSSLQVASIGVLTIVALVIESMVQPATRRLWRSA